MTHHRWMDVPSEQINDTIARRYITGDSVTIGRFELKKGGVVPSHAHPNEQVAVLRLLAGRAAQLRQTDDRSSLVRVVRVREEICF